MNRLVSILIPAYNSQEWISDTIRSAIAQNWPNKEIIIVDDGSKDSTLEIARKFESPNVRVFTQQNQGAAAARNKAFSLSQGDYIQWLDADDLLGPNKVSSQMAALDQGLSKRTLLSSGWAWFMYRSNRAKFVPSALWCDLSPAEWLLRKMDQNLHMQTATWLVSRELSEAAGQWNTNLLGDDDGEYFCRVLLGSEGTRFVPESRVYYRMAGTTSLSYIGRSDKKLDAQWHSMQLHVGYLRSLEDSPRVRAACVRYLQNWSFFFYPQRMDLFEKAELMAKDLGGQLHSPQFSWKYSWIDKLFGTNVAKRAQLLLRNAKWSVLRRYDKVLSVAEGKGVPGGSVLGES
jgi:glycosyltransferase involved in cell wall biosynthesis